MDYKGLDFIVFEQPERTILSGHVEGHKIKEFNSHLQVEIKSASDPLKIEYNFPLPLSNFFQVKDLPKGKHLVQLRSSLPKSTHRFESEVIEVDLEKHTQIHVGPLKYTIDFNHQKQVFLLCLSNVFLLWRLTGNQYSFYRLSSTIPGISPGSCIPSVCWSFCDCAFHWHAKVSGKLPFSSNDLLLSF